MNRQPALRTCLSSLSMVVLLSLGLLVPNPPTYSADWEAEEDPFRRCAKKALAGEFGELKPWQKQAYQWGLWRGVHADQRAKVTSYGYKWESRQMAGGIRTASGSHVHRDGCAANPGISFGAIVWTPYGLRYVFDRGGLVKLAYTNSREAANLDYYTWGPLPTIRNAPYALVKDNGTRSVWFRHHDS